MLSKPSASALALKSSKSSCQQRNLNVAVFGFLRRGFFMAEILTRGGD